jgi:hypothetical protein
VLYRAAGAGRRLSFLALLGCSLIAAMAGTAASWLRAPAGGLELWAGIGFAATAAGGLVALAASGSRVAFRVAVDAQARELLVSTRVLLVLPLTWRVPLQDVVGGPRRAWTEFEANSGAALDLVPRGLRPRRVWVLGDGRVDDAATAARFLPVRPDAPGRRAAWLIPVVALCAGPLLAAIGLLGLLAWTLPTSAQLALAALVAVVVGYRYAEKHWN